MSSPTLSVVMANYNHSRFLPEALDAILGQSFQPCEIILVDDASTDDSVRIIEDYARRFPIIRLIRNEVNQGHILSDNNAIVLAKGDYVHATAADDVILPGFYEKSMDLLAKYPQAGLCTSLMRSIDENGRDMGMFPVPIVATKPVYFPPDQVEVLLRQQEPWFTAVTMICNRKYMMEAGNFALKLRNYSDSVLSQVLSLKYGACFIPEVLGSWRRLEKGYANTSNASLETQIDILENAVKLFGVSPYAQMMPRRFAARWSRQWTFEVLLRSLQERKDQAGRVMRLSRHPADRLLLAFLRAAMHIEWLLVRIYTLIFLAKESLFKFMARQFKRDK
jgi:hypothetical protein